MKISVSLAEADVAFVDTYASRHSTNRSAAIAEAIETLRRLDVAAEYEEAYQEWHASGEAAVWDVTASDGLA